MPVEEIELGGLGEREVAELMHATCGLGAEPEFLRSVSRETAGNPFFIREICSHVAESGVSAQAFTLETLGVPEGVKQVIGRRIARLPEGVARLLTIGAVIGREFDLDVLVEVAGDADEDAVLDLLDHACAARLLEEVPGRIGRFAFVHALTREALYEGLSAVRRSRLHRRVAEVLESEHDSHLDEHLGELAYHDTLNVVGAFAGALVGSTWHAAGSRLAPQAVPVSRARAVAALIIALWLILRLWPLLPDASLGQLKRAVRPLFTPHLRPAVTAAYLIGWLVVAEAVFHLVRRQRAVDVLLVIIAVVLVGRTFVAGSALTADLIAALVLLLPSLVLINRLGSVRAPRCSRRCSPPGSSHPSWRRCGVAQPRSISRGRPFQIFLHGGRRRRRSRARHSATFRWAGC